MKTLVLLRHAKSSWDYPVDDIDRPLSFNGIRRIKKMVNNNKNIFTKTDVIYSSPANRASHTALILLRSINFHSSKIIFSDKLYTFSASSIKNFICSIPNKYDYVTIVGHNPAFTDIINKYSNKKITNLPTSCWVKIVFNIDNWNSIKLGDATLGLKDKIIENNV
jgi:phosphohistidine phosphatase